MLRCRELWTDQGIRERQEDRYLPSNQKNREDQENPGEKEVQTFKCQLTITYNLKNSKVEILSLGVSGPNLAHSTKLSYWESWTTIFSLLSGEARQARSARNTLLSLYATTSLRPTGTLLARWTFIQRYQNSQIRHRIIENTIRLSCKFLLIIFSPGNSYE